MMHASAHGRGRLKVFLGYAPGAGKSFRMLDEGRRRRERGQDVVVAAVQDYNTPDTENLLAGCELIPMLRIQGRGCIDVPRVLARHPRVCLVDGLAYDNPPGCPHAQRWEDVEEILQAGINVLGTVNLQYVAERQEDLERLTGKRAAETIPEAFLRTADNIEIVDATANPPLMQKTGMSEEELNLRLSTLREMALLLTADVVDSQLERYLENHGLRPPWSAHERILVCITPHSNALRMIASGRRNAERFHGELLAAYVQQSEISPEDQTRVTHYLDLAREQGAQVSILDGEDAVEAILHFARERGVTQIFVGHGRHPGWLGSRFGGSFVDKLIRRSGSVDVRVFPQ